MHFVSVIEHNQMAIAGLVGAILFGAMIHVVCTGLLGPGYWTRFMEATKESPDKH